MHKPVKTFLLLLTCCLLLKISQGQVLITPQIPPSGLIQKSQLWNVVLVNSSGVEQHAQIQMSLSDRNTGQRLMVGSSRMLLISKGATALRESDLGPIQYNYSGNYANIDRNLGNLLMAGGYVVCYTILSNKGEATAIAEDCVNMDIEPLSPAQLLSPADTVAIETNYPAFNWIPPAPVSMFTGLQYDFLLVEVKEKQSPYDAIQRNAPLYWQQHLTNPFLVYPSSVNALQPGKKYAWQVVVNNNKAYVQKTEVWSFTVKHDSLAIVIDNMVYPQLGKGVTAQSYICKGRMNFEYNNEAGDSLVIVHLYDIQNQSKVKVETRRIVMKPGQNFIDFGLNSGLYKNMQLYLLEIANNRNEYRNLKFKYVKNISND